SGSLTDAGTPVPVGLTSTAGNVVLFAGGTGCSSPIASLTIGSDATSAAFELFGTVTQTFAVNAIAEVPAIADSSATFTIAPAPPTGLTFTTVPPNVAATTCSPVNTIETRDQFGNISPAVVPIPVNLSGSPGSVTFYADANCTVPLSSPASLPAG